MSYRVLTSTMLEIVDGVEREPDTGRRRHRTSAANFGRGDVIPTGRLADEFERRYDAGDADIRSRIERIEIPGYDQSSES